MDYLKKRLLFSVAGLDRGFAANESAALAVETAIYSLVGAAGGSPPLTWSSSKCPCLVPPNFPPALIICAMPACVLLAYLLTCVACLLRHADKQRPCTVSSSGLALSPES